MADLLVKLYDLPAPGAASSAPAEVAFRRPLGPEHGLAVAWVASTFGAAWASEAEAALGNRPVTCLLAIEGEAIVGFACHDATALGYFGPIGVAPGQRGRGIGVALLRATLADMRQRGYGYAIVGGVGTEAQRDFYRRSVGAIEIADSTPGLYRGMLRARPD